MTVSPPLKMFSDEVFIAECIVFIQTKSYEDYEDVKIDIELFVKNNLPSELSSLELERRLCGEILAKYIEYEYENSPSDEELEDEELEDDADDILFESVEIWLAAHTRLRQKLVGG